jgi:hypothetical protein
MTEHSCRAVGCPVIGSIFMCPRHWGLVPEAVRILLVRHRGTNPGEESSTDYLATAFVAISCVALQEGKTLPTLDSHIMRTAAEAILAQGAENPVRHKTEQTELTERPQASTPYPD